MVATSLVGVPIKDAGPEVSKKAPILIGPAATASPTEYPQEKATVMAQSKTRIFLLVFMLEPPFLDSMIEL
jgi:hypothetical protein